MIIDKNVTTMVNKKAVELIESKFDNLIETIDDVKDGLIYKLDRRDIYE